MDFAAIGGLVLAFGMILLSMILEGTSPMSIMLPAPMVLVFGGTFGAGMVGGMLKDTIGFGKQIPRALLAKTIVPGALVDSIVALADRARREGLLALEDAVKGVNDPFLQRGLQFAIDGTDPDELRDILESEVDAKRKADKSAAKIFADMGGYAPTIGIIGTVIGLIKVLSNLSNPGELGASIASAFVATLWGILSANVMWLPLSSRLKRISELECAQMELAVEGIIAIQAGANPRVVAQKLKSLLPPGTAEASAKAA